MMHNNLFLNRLVVFTNGNKIAFDETFHEGVNIIAGDNSSGKSTISHFIFYVLGGSFNDWVKEAKQCSVVIAEVEMNGAVFTLRREININSDTRKANANEAMYIFWGSYVDSSNASVNDWSKYNYSSTENIKSFSNVFFDNLGLPIVKGDSSNITFHQLLRLLYVDQDSPTSSLFFYEQFDTTLTRETVSDLLLGVYNQELYDSKQRLIEVNNELDNARKEIKIIKQFAPSELDLHPAHLLTKIGNAQKEISSLEDELLQLKEHNKEVRYNAKSKLEFEKLNEESVKQREIVNTLDSYIHSLKLEISDSNYFVEALESKIKAIKNSILTREFLGDFPLEYCPECLSPLHKNGEENCKLCKEPSDKSFGVTQARKIEQELGFQIKESKKLLLIKSRELNELESKFQSEKVQLTLLQKKVNTALNDVKSFRDEKIDSLLVDKGVLEGEILQLRTLLENAEFYQSLIKKRVDLEEEHKRLTLTINKLTLEQEKLKLDINKVIEKKGCYLLNNDLKHQDDFIDAKEFHIDYRNNLAFISDKEAKYSASSNFYLKTSARFAIFLASLEIERMRYPRFILCDNMEDKGIQPERAQNFQRIIIEEAEKHSTSQFQLIYTTSYLPEDLKESKYIVGEFYTKANRTLKNISY